MTRLTSFFALAILSLCCFLPSRPAQAALDFGPGTCTAVDASTLQACVAQLQAYDGATNTTTEIVLQSMITCSGNDCNIVLNSSSFPNAPTLPGTGVKQPPQIVITGNPDELPSASGLHRIDGFDYRYGMVDVTGLSNVTISAFTIYDDPTPVSITVDGTVDVSGTEEYPVFCAGPDANSTVGNPSVQGVSIAASDTGVTSCPVPGYVTVKITDSATKGGFDYPDVNTACFETSKPYHYCASDQISISADSNVTISNMVLDHSQGGSVDVGGGTTGFYFLDNTVENAYFRGLSVTAENLSIEGNTFFANRAAGLHVYGVSSSSGKRPSDISNNIFDHNQHGDAFPCSGQEGCSGGQMAIAGSDFVFYGNTFINGYMDFYDPTVLEQVDGHNAFSGCNLSVQCSYAGTGAGTLWANGGGVTSGPDYQSAVAGNPHRNPEVELDKTITGLAVFSHNSFDYGSIAITYDPGASSTQLQLYDNELFDNGQGDFYPSSGAQLNVSEQNDCYSAGCEASIGTAPAIVGEGPTTAAAERNDCGNTNCLWVLASDAWAPQQNSLALGSSGSAVQCALNIYGPGGGTLLATVQGSAAYCNANEGVFTIPASVAQHQTSVQIAFENLGTGQVSAKQLVPLAGMTPTITGLGTPTCTNGPCAWITATDAVAGNGNCAVGIYTVSGALITTMTGSSVTCTSTEATFYIPATVLNNYTAVDVNYQNLVQGTWSGLARMTVPTTGGTGTGGGGIGKCGGTTGITCP